jgi:hypothetical protein
MKFEIKNRYTDAVIYTWETDEEVTGLTYGEKLGRAVQAAIKARAYLADANLAGASLARANLTDANLTGAYLAGANLADANLADANLAGAYLAGASLARANLADANLTGAYLAGASLAGASLARANLADANLTGAYLAGASLAGAYLAGAKNAELVIARTRILPEGDIIGWKKCKANVIVKLRIPAEAKRSHAFGRKCRAEYADVLEVFGADEGVTNNHGPETVYRPGTRVLPDSFCENWQNECSNGIHFFITREEAEAYV